MSDVADPLSRGAAAPLPTRGEGCLRRYDPDELSAEHGTEFCGAAELWRELVQDDARTQKKG